jgi:carbonic anhydrase
MNHNPGFIPRRDLLKLGSIAALGWAATASDWLGQVKPAIAAELNSTAPATLSPDAALKKLVEGNRRFVQHQPQYPDQSKSRVQEVAQAQYPFATILSCADSRAPAEILFDQGLGDLFDVRIAGNIATPEAIGSIEYAVVMLGTPLLLVLGHERCGAITAAVQNKSLPGEISTFVNAVLPAVNRVKDRPGDWIDNAVTANVQYQMEQLQRSSLLRERLESGKLKIAGGRYDLDTGMVTLIA